jgi:hypothetical protein
MLQRSRHLLQWGQWNPKRLLRRGTVVLQGRQRNEMLQRRPDLLQRGVLRRRYSCLLRRALARYLLQLGRSLLQRQVLREGSVQEQSLLQSDMRIRRVRA